MENILELRKDKESMDCIAVKLQKEINDFKEALIRIDKAQSTDSISDNVKRIAIQLQIITDKKLYFTEYDIRPTPIQTLLSLHSSTINNKN